MHLHSPVDDSDIAIIASFPPALTDLSLRPDNEHVVKIVDAVLNLGRQPDDDDNDDDAENTDCTNSEWNLTSFVLDMGGICIYKDALVSTTTVVLSIPKSATSCPT